MSDTTKTLPEQILETSQAFTQTLEMENKTFQGQLNGIVGMTVDALQKLILLCKDAVAIPGRQYDLQISQTISNLKQAFADIQHATANANKIAAPALPEVPPAGNFKEPDLNATVINSVGMTYQNAVAAQQQAYITQQAATTMIISTLLSVTTAAVSIAVQKAEQEKTSA